MGSTERVANYEELQPLLEQSPVLFAMMTPSKITHSFHWVSPNIQNLLGYSPDEACREGWWLENIHPTEREYVDTQFRQAVQRQADQVLEYRFATRSGDYRHIRNHIHFNGKGPDGSPYIYQLWSDTSEGKQINNKVQSLHRAYTLLTSTIEATLNYSKPNSLYQAICNLAITQGHYQLAWVGLIDNKTGAIEPVARAGRDDGYVEHIRANSSATMVEGQGPVGLAIRHGQPVIVSDIESDSRMGPWRERALSNGFNSVIALPIHVAQENIGALMMYSDSVHYFDEDERNLLIKLAHNLSQGIESIYNKKSRQLSEEHLHQIAFYDELTNLPNNTFFHHYLDQALIYASSQSRPLTLAILTLMDLESIQQMAGYQIAEGLLKLEAEALKHKHKGFLAYLGQGRFCFLFEDINDSQQALAQLQDLIITAGQPYDIEGTPLEPHVACGVSIYPDHGQDATQLYRKADLAMIAAREQRKPLLVYMPAMEPDPRNLTLMSDLRQAIEARELSWIYQPKYSPAESRVIGAEMLVRWQHPRHGWLSPGLFIPLAEKTGLIKKLTRSALHQAIQTVRQWGEAGSDWALSVNVSGNDLADPAIVSEIIEQVDKYACLLTLEITETAVMQDVDAIIQNVRRLQAAGLKLSLDDYGTGYSSLSSLRQLNFDKIKIDMSFIKNMLRSDRDQKIVQASIYLGHNLGASIIAEGVEDFETAKRLQMMDCDTLQGFGIARPMPLDEFVTFSKECNLSDQIREAGVN